MTQPLRRELDWGQGVLDFVRESPGDFAPGRIALRLNQGGHIINDQNVPTALVSQSLNRCSSAKKLLSSARSVKSHLQGPGLLVALNVGSEGIHEFGNMRIGPGQDGNRPPQIFREIGMKNRGGSLICGQNRPLGIKTKDGG